MPMHVFLKSAFIDIRQMPALSRMFMKGKGSHHAGVSLLHDFEISRFSLCIFHIPISMIYRSLLRKSFRGNRSCINAVQNFSALHHIGNQHDTGPRKRTIADECRKADFQTIHQVIRQEIRQKP